MKSQMMSPCSHRRQKGLTLIELLIALALIAFFTFLIFGRGNEAQTRADVSAERDFVQSLLPSIRGLKDGASYAAVSTQTLINSGTVDRSRINGTDLVNTQAGVMTVAPGNWNGGTNNAFVVTNPGLPRAICTAVGQGFGQISYVQQVTINGQVVKDSSQNVNATATTVGARCNDQNNTVILLGT